MNSLTGVVGHYYLTSMKLLVELVEKDRGSDDKPGPSRDITTKLVQLTLNGRSAPFNKALLDCQREKGLYLARNSAS